MALTIEDESRIREIIREESPTIDVIGAVITDAFKEQITAYTSEIAKAAVAAARRDETLHG